MMGQRRAILVLGSSGGIGAALCSYILEKGNEDIKLYALQRREGFATDKRISIIHFDLQKPSFDVLEQRLAADLDRSIEEIVLILSAGTIVPISCLADITQEEYEKNIRVNIEGQVHLVSYVINESKKVNAKVRIIAMDSGAAYHPIRGWGLYCSAKAYISMYLRVLNEENPTYRIVLIDPGVVDTRMQEKIRRASKSVFPRKNEFVKYKEDNLLKSPLIVAKDIVDRYVLDWRATTIMERLE